MKVEVEDKDKNDEEYDCDDVEDSNDGRDEGFNCDFKGCKRSYKRKGEFLQHFKSHFTGDLTCKQYGMTFRFKVLLNRHLLVHENKK